jgi:hypothetical protein
MPEVIHPILLAAHLLGMAAIVGTFFVQMRARSGFATGVVLAGAITQLVTGVALVGFHQSVGQDVDNVKIAVKLGIAVAVLVAAILAHVAARRGRNARPAFHTAGGLALVNVLVAVLWP